MKILHLPMEVGGQVGELVMQLRALGHQAVGYNWRHVYLKYEDIMLHSDAYEMTNSFETALEYFDVFHYHTGYTLFKDKSDIERAVEAGKKVVMHHRGNDVRMPSLAAKGPHHVNPYVYTGDSLPEDQIKANLAYFSKYIKAAIVQDYELYDYVASYYQNIHILPRPIHLERVKPSRVAASARPTVVHAPTSRSFKGTDDIVRTVERLRKEIPFRFVLLEKMSKKETMARMRKADIVIDQINCGMYGNVSVEAMALGKSVICYLRPDIQARLPEGLPIVSANKDTLYDALRELLLQQPEERMERGKQGRVYVEKHHDARNVAKQLVSIYESL